MQPHERLLYTEICAFMRSNMRLRQPVGVMSLRKAEEMIAGHIDAAPDLIWQSARNFVEGVNNGTAE